MYGSGSRTKRRYFLVLLSVKRTIVNIDAKIRYLGESSQVEGNLNLLDFGSMN